MSVITTINATDRVTDSRAVLNTNLANLNTDKIETLANLGLTETALAYNNAVTNSPTVGEKAALVGGGVLGTPSVSNKFLTQESLSVGSFGDGSDGNVTITGTVTLTRDMFYDNLIVTGTLNTDGYRVFVRDTISGVGTVTNSNTNNGGGGAAGATSGGGGGGAGGTLRGSGIWKGVAGVAGGQGNDGTPRPTTPASGANGDRGGNGASGGAGGLGWVGEAGGLAGVVGTNTTTRRTYDVFGALHFTFYSAAATLAQHSLVGSSGGGGGSGRDNESSGGGGGGSGGSGGVILIFAARWTGTFTISSIGGNGGNGGNGHVSISVASGGGGGGAGGAGGVVVFVYGVKTWTGSFTLTGGTGGTGGLSGGSGSVTAGVNGANGSTGVAYEYALSTLI